VEVTVKPLGERKPAATGANWPSGVISTIQPRHGTGDCVVPPKATFNVTRRLPLGASTGPKAYS
jgi:hypothetical protein